MATGPLRLASTGVVLALIVAATAIFDQEQDGVLSLVQELAGASSFHPVPFSTHTTIADAPAPAPGKAPAAAAAPSPTPGERPPPVDDYEKIPGLLYEPKKVEDFTAVNEEACRTICNKSSHPPCAPSASRD